MEIKEQPKLRLITVDFARINFKSFKRFSLDDESKIDLGIIPKIFMPEDNPNIFNIIMDVNISSKDYFELSLLCIGVFELKGADDEKLRKSFINCNAPAIMFPYIRSFVSTLTGNLGEIMPTLRIPPQFFSGELEEYNTKEEE